MSLLSTVKKGPEARPHFIVLHGTDGVGKSRLAAGAPNPIFLGSENNQALDVAKFPSPENLQEFFAQLGSLIDEEHDYGTVVVDSLDWLEPLVLQNVCKEYDAKTIEEVGGGFQKGYIFALPLWKRMLKAIELLRDRGINVILIAHSYIKTFNDPEANESYDRYILKLHDKAAALIREAADDVLFLNYETNTFKEKKAKKATATADGSRVIYTERRPAFDAKNRNNLPYEIEIPREAQGANSWKHLVKHYPQYQTK